MDRVFNCPACQASLTVPTASAGQDIRCPKCREVIRVPEKDAAARPSRPLLAGLEIPELEELGRNRGAQTVRWLVRSFFGLILLLAATVLVLRGEELLNYVRGMTMDEFWLRIKIPYIFLDLFFNALTAVIAGYVIYGCVRGLGDDAAARPSVIAGLSYFLAVRVFHLILAAYLSVRMPAAASPLRIEVQWMVGSLVVCGAIIYFLSHVPELRLYRRFSLSESDGIELVQSLMAKAVHARASDLHLEPTPEGGMVRFRVDGFLFPVVTLPMTIAERVVSRVKVMGQMDIAEKRLPQDGQAMFRFGDHEIDLRISTVPSSYGERLVVRFLDREHGLIGLDKLGLSTDCLKKTDRILKSPHGVLFCTGPTGAGKSTTLYAALMAMNKSDRNVITLEDPIEFHIPGITQLPVAKKKGMSFASGLRSILRQDPDVIMVGEVRDGETAHMCIQASQTGHLVLSTLHTNDAPGAVARMLDLGSEPYLLASSLRAVVAQRLVRLVCPLCSMPYQPTADELTELGLPADETGDFRKGRGCAKCLSTGYFGRIGIFELLLVDDVVRKLITERADAFTIRDAAIAAGMVTLRGDGLNKARAGLTTVEEVFRVTASDLT